MDDGSNSQPEGTKVGEITHFFPNISVAVIRADAEINLGDKVKIYDKDSNVVVEQDIASMEIDRKPIEVAEKGVEFAMKVEGEVKEGYLLYRS